LADVVDRGHPAIKLTVAPEPKPDFPPS
jgi:hypothetical protein